MRGRQRLRLGVVVATALGFATLAPSLRAMFLMPEVENVPIERLTKNLEVKIQADPRDVQSLLNLARLHAMAYASKTTRRPH